MGKVCPGKAEAWGQCERGQPKGVLLAAQARPVAVTGVGGGVAEAARQKVERDERSPAQPLLSKAARDSFC